MYTSPHFVFEQLAVQSCLAIEQLAVLQHRMSALRVVNHVQPLYNFSSIILKLSFNPNHLLSFADPESRCLEMIKNKLIPFSSTGLRFRASFAERRGK